jgi:hypothetical protein
MREKLRFLGLDVHVETIAVAVAEPLGRLIRCNAQTAPDSASRSQPVLQDRLAVIVTFCTRSDR